MQFFEREIIESITEVLEENAFLFPWCLCCCVQNSEGSFVFSVAASVLSSGKTSCDYRGGGNGGGGA